MRRPFPPPPPWLTDWDIPGPIPPPPRPPPWARPPPLIGVTDGSKARPGEVGEVFAFARKFTTPAYPGATRQLLQMGVVPPGDWNLWSFVGFSGPVGVIASQLATVPPGLSNTLFIWFGGFVRMQPGGSGVGLEESLQLNSPVATFTTDQPTLFSFYLIVDNALAADAVATPGTLYLQGRRMR